MSRLEELEKEALNLSPRERERLVLAMWNSLDSASTVIDPEGIDEALRRNADVETGSVQTMSHSEFKRRTGAADEG